MCFGYRIHTTVRGDFSNLPLPPWPRRRAVRRTRCRLEMSCNPILWKSNDPLTFSCYAMIGITTEAAMKRVIRAPKPRNLSRVALADPIFRHKLHRKKKGKASYARKGRTSNGGAVFDMSTSYRNSPRNGISDKTSTYYPIASWRRPGNEAMVNSRGAAA